MFGQDTIWIKEGNKKYMYKGTGEWLFKDNLPDGHYCSYDYGDKKFPSVEVSFVNGKKEGIESRYYSFSKEKYATISWKNGMKNGLETHYNGNKTIHHILTFKDNILNGFFEINWSEGQNNYKGFYKNGFRDSIWTYYETGNKIQDSSDYWMISKQYQYRNGKPYLISAWNKQGLQTLYNGNGILTDSGYFTTTTTYLNGMKNGKQVTTKIGGTVDNERIYKDDLLLKEIFYSDNNQIKYISEWSYPSPAIIDTNREWVDPYITDIYYNAISYTYTPVPNGQWVAFYSNGIKIYEGDYCDGNKIGVWKWNFPNGKQKIFADNEKNIWQHYDTTGKIISILNNEYLTLLTHNTWYLNQTLDTSVVTLEALFSFTSELQLTFQPDGQVKLSCWECPTSTNNFSLSVDTLTLVIDNNGAGDFKIFKYQIVSANNESIMLNRIN